LEPCAHTGRTRPCADALIAAGVRRVLVAVRDPWPTASGGAERLRASGIEVEVGLLADEATAVNEPWLVAVRRGRPFVTWLVRATLDGRVAAPDGTPLPGGPDPDADPVDEDAAAARIRALRTEVDAVLIGVGTVLAADPTLTVLDRHGRPARRQPLRVVADSAGRTPVRARVRDAATDTWIATVAELGAGPDGRLDLTALMDALHARQRRHVLLEGGPRLAGGMVAAGLVDRLVAYFDTALLGGGPAVLESGAVTTVADVWRWQIARAGAVGSSVHVEARPV
jgi:diaminohydroxyphosphoribosylaminopyrimidine deaminase/5-amino-6-(5-phosphoribosylamino)uracil reductase